MSRFTNSQRRWSDNDKHWGPFTYAPGDYWRLGFEWVTSSYGNCIRFYGGKRTLILELPNILKRHQISYSTHDVSYGPTLSSEGFFTFDYGPQTMDSSTTKSWSCHLPWTRWRSTGKWFYGEHGELIKYFPPHKKGAFDSWKQEYEFRQTMPKIRFEFDDYDGKRIIATTYVDETRIVRGVSWFKWLSLVTKPRVSRSLNLDFSEEVGPEKGSWKGGLVGHSIEMLDKETPEQAFRRYCAKDHEHKRQKFSLTFVSRLP